MGLAALGAIPVAGDVLKKGAGNLRKFYHGGKKDLKSIYSSPPSRGNLGSIYLTDDLVTAQNYAYTNGPYYNDKGQLVESLNELKNVRKKAQNMSPEQRRNEGINFDPDKEVGIHEFYLDDKDFIDIDTIDVDEVSEVIGREEIDTAVDEHITSNRNFDNASDLDDWDLEMAIDDYMGEYTTEELGDIISYDAKLLEDSPPIVRFLAATGRLNSYLSKKKESGYKGFIVKGDPESPRSETAVVFDPKAIKRVNQRLPMDE